MGTRRRPPVQAPRVPDPAPPAPVEAPSAPVAPLPAPMTAAPPPGARKAPSRPAAGQRRAVVFVATPDALLARYAAALGHTPPGEPALRALLHGLLAEQAEAIAQHLEGAAAANADEPLHRDAAPPLLHAALVVRGAFGVRSMR